MSQEKSALNRLPIFVLFIIASGVIHDVYAKPAQRLVGGSDTAPGEIVFMASLRWNNKHICGGALVSPRHVLTAAHCVYNVEFPYDVLTVRTGTNNLEKGGTISKVDDIDIHENYTSNPDGSFNNDIALIKLQHDVEINSMQSAIGLSERYHENRVVALVSGWGMSYDEYPDGDYSTILQKSDMSILNHKECQKLHKLNRIGVENICGFRNSFSGVCSGDDGSPVFADGLLIGIVSWYYPCAIGVPDVYVSVHHNYDWILEGLLKGYYDAKMD